MFFLYQQHNAPISEKAHKLCTNTYNDFCRLTYSAPQETPDNLYFDKHTCLITSLDCYSQIHRSENLISLIHGDLWQDSKPITTEAIGDNIKKTLAESGKKDFNWRGNFAALTYEKERQSITLINDPLGLQPVFYYSNDQFFITASRFEHILPFVKDLVSINWEAIREYISFGAALPGSNLFEQIIKLPPSSTLVCSGGKVVVNEYNNSLNTTPFCGNLSEASQNVFTRLAEGTNKLVKYYKVQKCYLTGGSDSRLLVSLLGPQTRQNLKYLCYSNVEWSVGNDDAEIAKLLAKYWDLDLEVIPEPLKNNHVCTPDAYKASRFNLVPEPTLTGSFGTETVGGAPFTHFGCDITNLEKKDYLRTFSYLLGKDDKKNLSRTYDKLFDNLYSQGGGSKEYNFFLKWLWQSQLTSIYSGYNSGAFIYSYSNLLKQKISPFMDDLYLEFMMQLPREFLMKYAIYRALFHNQLSDVAKVPFNSNMLKHVPDLPHLEPKENVGKASSFNHRQFALDYVDKSFLKDSPFCTGHIINHLKHHGDRNFSVRICDLIVWHDGLFKNEPFSKETFEAYTTPDK